MPVSALVDTGSEVNLFRRGLVDNKFTKACGAHVGFFAANQQSLGGNHRRLSCEFLMEGVEVDSGSKQGYTFPFKGYDASIDVDVLLSYEWLARHNFIVNTRRHGLSLDFQGTSNWFPGVREGEVLKVPHPVVRRVKDRSQESVPNQSTETFMVRKEFYEEFCHRLGLKPDRDCFASPEVSQCEKYFTVE